MDQYIFQYSILTKHANSIVALNLKKKITFEITLHSVLQWAGRQPGWWADWRVELMRVLHDVAGKIS